VDKVDAPDSDFEHADAGGWTLGLESLRDDDPKAVVSAQEVPDADDDYVHVEQDTVVDATTELIDSLQERIRRYPAERYPIQHATAQFHLGIALANCGRAEDAERALRTALALFDPVLLPLEHAKALNALGAALRGSGRLDEAAEAFGSAAEAFAAATESVEEGAAVFNLGLVERQRGELERAAACFRQAAEKLGPRRGPALRELGVLSLEQGDVEAATATLEDAVAVHAEMGEEPGRGAAANALALAYLGSGRIGDAIATFREALTAHPRTVRAREFAMTKANLALAYEQAADLPRARLAARQALNVPDAPDAVRTQVGAVLDRIGAVTDDLVVVLASEPPDRHAVILREEVPHWDRTDAGAFVDADPEPDLVEAWLAALLELPPDELTAAIEATHAALAERPPAARDQFESSIRATLPRFHQPQMLRLEAAFGWSTPPT
jgi:tetratricopeptide (TPR) repeat protein